MRWTRVQWTILIVAWLGWVFDVMDAALFNFAKVPMFTEILGADQYKLVGAKVEGQVQAVFLLGWAIGGLVFGILADRWGRTRTLILTILLYSLFTGLTALCRTPEQVALVRFLTALGIGGEWAAGAALVAETFRSGGRGPASSFLQSAAAIGPALAALLNLGLAELPWESLTGRPSMPWQVLFLVGVIPALLCVIIRLAVREPESPPKDAPFPLREILKNPVWRRRAVVAMIIGTVGVAGAQTATYWLPNLVTAASQGRDDIPQRISYATLIAHIGTLAGVIVVPWLCDRLGRRTTIFCFYLLTPFVVAFAIWGGADYVRILLTYPLVFFFAVGISASFVLYFPELFPTRMRATGAGLAYNVGRVLSIPMPIFTGWMTTTQFGGSIVTAVLMSGCVYMLGLMVVPFAPETKGQPLLEENLA